MMITDRMSQLRVVMQYDCEMLMEYIASDRYSQEQVYALIADYKAKKAELKELEAQWEKEYLAR